MGGKSGAGDGHDHDHDHDHGHDHDGHHHHHHHGGAKEPPGLTKNESLVWETLVGCEGPLKAYEILDQLKEKGVRAPMTVYRALEGLEEKGFIHKLEGLNSFLPCKHEGPHEVQVFLICDTCASATEVELEGIDTLLRPVLRRAAFAMRKARLEASGRCSACQND